MTALTFAVVLVGALCVVDLLLTFGIMRRLRDDSASRLRQNDPGLAASMAPVGTTIAGTAIGWGGTTLVGFFMPGCGPCDKQLPEFVASARKWDRVLAVVLDPAGDGAKYVRELEQVAQVVVEDSSDGALLRAFAVEGYPIFCVVRDGVISSVVRRARDLAEQAARVPA
ncbi:hypothetical protein ABGB07_14470 [Micromonosporaceae bacterium B7E4]